MATEQPARGYTATKDQLRTRLRRVEGQVHVRHCVIGGHAKADPAELSGELMATMGRLVRRG